MLERFHLQVLMAVNTHGTLTKAAESLNLTQSALSHSIKKLENEMGTAVWKKDGRNLRLTMAGREILSFASRVLPQFSHTEQRIKDIALGKSGTLRIGMECHPCYQWLLKIIAPFLQQWPDIDLDVIQQFKFGGLAALHNYEIDLLVTPDPLFTPKVDFIPVKDYEHKLGVAASHWLGNQQMVQPEQLADETLITYPVEPQRLDIFSQFLQPANCKVKKHKTIETTEIMMQMVAAGRGICALPDWRIDEYASTLQLRALQFGVSGIHKQIHLGIRKDDVDTPCIESFIALSKNQRL